MGCRVLSRTIRPPFLGALYVLALTALFGAGGSETEALGKNAHSIVDFVHQHFAGDLFRLRTAVALFAIATGVWLGTLSGLLIRTRQALHRVKIGAGTFWHALALTSLLHSALMLWAMATWPALYAPAFHEAGGARRAIQFLATDLLGRTGSLALFIAVPIVYAIFPLRSVRLERSRRLLVPAAGALALLLTTVTWLHWRPSQAPRTPATADMAKRTSVLILAADSLRADRFDRDHMPRTFAFAERGTIFENAYVSLPRTFPSWTTLLTGRYPHHHGIRSMFPRWQTRAKDFDAMPAHFSNSGARTLVVSDFAGDVFSRIPFGFDEVDAPTFNLPEFIGFRALERSLPVMPWLHSYLGRRLFPSVRELHTTADPTYVADRTRLALSSLPAATPFFITTFFSTTHFPYAAPSPFYKTSDGYVGDLKFGKLIGLEGANRSPSDTEAAHARALYDGAVRSVDDAMADLLAWMEASGMLLNTVVVITADHGETIYENDRGIGHGDHLWGDEAIHVPLAIFGPGVRSGGHVVSHVRDVDLAPTLCELAHVAPPSAVDGESLVPALDGKPLADRDVFAETGLWFSEQVPGVDSSLRLPYPAVERATEVDAEHGQEMVLSAELFPLTVVAKHRMVQRGKYKLVYMPTPKGAQSQLFNVEADPHNLVDIAESHPEEVGTLREALFSWIAHDPSLIRVGDRFVFRDHAPIAKPLGLRLEAR